MTDVLISYAPNDKERIKPFVDALTHAGLDVWWNRDVAPVSMYRKAIEQEFHSVKCILVLWSQNSHGSDFVHDEASFARDRGVLVPVAIDEKDPPSPFNRLHTEKLSDWGGDTESEAWQRTLAQVLALIAPQGATIYDAPTGTKGNIGGSKRVEGRTEDRPHHFLARYASTNLSHYLLTCFFVLSALAALFGLRMLWPDQTYDIAAITLVLAVTSLALFRIADVCLGPHTKVLARGWLFPASGSVATKTAEAFNAMFEAVFRPEHFTWKCFIRSALASSIALPIMFIFFDLAIIEVDAMTRWVSEPASRAGLLYLVFPLLPLFSINILGDYISLFETRMLLQFARTQPNWLLPIVVFDAILTALIFSLATVLIYCLTFMDGNNFSILYLAKVFLTHVYYLLVALPFGLSIPEADLNFLGSWNIVTLTFYAGLATAYITSVWLWIAVLYAPIARFLLGSRAIEITWFGQLFETASRPVGALGYLIAILILVTGGIIWLANFTYQALAGA